MSFDDFSEAFDKAPHFRLIWKIKAHGIHCDLDSKLAWPTNKNSGEGLIFWLEAYDQWRSAGVRDQF